MKKCKDCRHGKLLGKDWIGRWVECLRIYCQRKRKEMGLWNHCEHYSPKLLVRIRNYLKGILRW